MNATNVTKESMSNYQTEKRSPWFSVRDQPPVNGGKKSLYEWRCKYTPGRGLRKTKHYLLTVYSSCSGCQWRGLLREKT